MNILNIGGAGYIGSVTTEKLIKNKHKVIVLDDLSTGFKRLVHPRAIFIKGSILDGKLLDKIFKSYKIDLVILFAAKIVVSESVKFPSDYYLVNVGGTAMVLKAMEKNNVKKIIFASSAAVYGESDSIISEDSPKNPCSPYGKSKLIGEQLLIDAHNASNINYVIFRFFNVAGASNSGKYGMLKEKPTLLIPSISNSILNNKNINIYGNNFSTKDGTCIRDYIHVEDIANAILLGINYLKSNKSNIFCLCSQKGYSTLEIVKKAQSLISKKIKYSIHKKRLGDPAKILASNKKTKKILKWQTTKNIDDMILSDYKFRKQNLK